MNIISYSGGKDSTAMIIKLIENDVNIDEILYVDMGKWIWEEVEEHNNKVEKKLGIKITKLKLEEDLETELIKYGFPSIHNRWCTGIKNNTMRKYINKKYPKQDITYYIGYCVNESNRIFNNISKYLNVKYPLVDLNITNEDALKICYDYGFDFGGLYEHHSHISCWLCPLQKEEELKWLYDNKIDKWDYLIELQRLTYGKYKNKSTIYDIEKKFWLNNYDSLKDKSINYRKKVWVNKFIKARERGLKNENIR